MPFTTDFVISNSHAVPEFPLGMFVVVGVSAVMLIVLRTGIRKSYVPAGSP